MLHLRWAAVRERGQAVVEFALAAPFLLMFIFFIADTGFLAYSYVDATSGIREAVRCAAVGGTDEAIEARIVEIGAGIGTVDPSSVVVTHTPDPPQVGGEVEVQATYTYDWITPVGLVGIADISFTRSASMRMESNTLNKVDC